MHCRQKQPLASSSELLTPWWPDGDAGRAGQGAHCPCQQNGPSVTARGAASSESIPAPSWSWAMAGALGEGMFRRICPGEQNSESSGVMKESQREPVMCPVKNGGSGMTWLWQGGSNYSQLPPASPELSLTAAQRPQAPGAHRVCWAGAIAAGHGLCTHARGHTPGHTDLGTHTPGHPRPLWLCRPAARSPGHAAVRLLEPLLLSWDTNWHSCQQRQLMSVSIASGG